MTKTNDMLTAFDRFSASIEEGMAQARAELERGNYEGCQNVLAAVAVAHAKTSMSLRSLCIRRGLMRGDDE